jgi:hypothetical protein
MSDPSARLEIDFFYGLVDDRPFVKLKVRVASEYRVTTREWRGKRV